MTAQLSNGRFPPIRDVASLVFFRPIADISRIHFRATDKPLSAASMVAA